MGDLLGPRRPRHAVEGIKRHLGQLGNGAPAAPNATSPAGLAVPSENIPTIPEDDPDAQDAGAKETSNGSK